MWEGGSFGTQALVLVENRRPCVSGRERNNVAHVTATKLFAPAACQADDAREMSQSISGRPAMGRVVLYVPLLIAPWITQEFTAFAPEVNVPHQLLPRLTKQQRKLFT